MFRRSNNFEKLKGSIVNNKEDKEKKKELSMKVVHLEDLPPGHFFTAPDGKKGRVVALITRDPKVEKNVRVIWPDNKSNMESQLVRGKELVKIKKTEEKKLELEENILGKVKPHQMFYYGEKQGKILIKPEKGKDISVRFEGENGKEKLPWNTKVRIQKEKLD